MNFIEWRDSIVKLLLESNKLLKGINIVEKYVVIR